MFSSNEAGEQWWSFGSIFSVQVLSDGNVEFAEECDYWHKEVMTKEDAVEKLKSAIRYIEIDSKELNPKQVDA